MNVALPAIRDDLGGGLAAQQGVVEGYLLLVASLLLVGGALGDLLGRRRVFVVGVAGFGIASVLCAAAPTVLVLVVARLLQGAAAALLVPSSLALITDAFPGRAERGRAIGIWTSLTSASMALGPPIGGVLVDLVSWRAIFVLNLPLVAATLWVTLRRIPERRPEGGDPIDVVGAVLVTLGLAGTVAALVEQPSRGWGDALVAGPGIAGVALLVAFAAWEHRAPFPMLPPSFLRERRVAALNLATLGVYAGLIGATFYLGIVLQQLAGYAAIAAGSTLLPLTFIMITLSPRAGALVARVGPRPLLTVGPLLAAAGLLLLAGVGADARFLPDVLPGVVLLGLGMATTVSPLTSTVMDAAPAHHAGLASGVNNAVARLAGLVAIAVLGAVIGGAWGSSLRDSAAGAPDPVVRRAALAVADRPLVRLSTPDRAAPPARAAIAAAQDRATASAVGRGMRLGAAFYVLAAIAAFVGLGGAGAGALTAARSGDGA